MPNPALLVAVGCATGFLAGLLGAGGGFATVVLLLAAGASAHEAVGTSLIFTIVVGAWGTALHLRKGTASWWLAAALGLPSAATALGGAQLAAALPERTLVLAFAGLTLVVAAAFLASGSRLRKAESDVLPVSGAQVLARESDAVRPTRRLIAGAIAGGAAIGVLKGVFGVGGGFVLVPFMVLALRVPERVAVGSSLFAILLGSISGGIKHATLGNVDGSMLVYLIPGGLVGSFAGASLVKKVSPLAIRRSFVALMLASAAYLLAKGL